VTSAALDDRRLPMLGKKRPRFDNRTLKLANYLTPSALPTPPQSVDCSGGRTSWPMFDNDKIGDCTCATAAGFVEQWTATGGRVSADVLDPQVITAYSAVTGYDPATGANDNGASELDVLAYWQKVGIGGHQIGAYVALNVYDPVQVYAALWLFNGVYVGAALPVTCQGASEWVVDSAAGSQAYPGSWGGHAFGLVAALDPSVVADTDPGGMKHRTWGGLMPTSWAWWRTYVEEAYAIVSADYLVGGRTVEGFDAATLQADLAAVGG
jgi:hypothetical protein